MKRGILIGILVTYCLYNWERVLYGGFRLMAELKYNSARTVERIDTISAAASKRYKDVAKVPVAAVEKVKEEVPLTVVAAQAAYAARLAKKPLGIETELKTATDVVEPTLDKLKQMGYKVIEVPEIASK